MLSQMYQAGVFLRNTLYDRGVFPVVKVDIPVVSVGNIMAGGTGKTPFVKMLAEELSKNLKVAIISRGYKGSNEKTGQSHEVTTVFASGDEPFWLKQKLPQVQVWVGKNRVLSARLAQEKGAQVVIMDDGMQHRRLHRDIEIVVVGQEPFDHFLPLGLLRDSPKRLKNADLIVSMGGSENELRRYTHAPCLHLKKTTSLSLTGKKVGVFCAIGQPEQFLKSVQEAGAEVIASHFKPDHASFTAKELEKLPGELLICTEKDFVKNPPDSRATPLPSELEIVQGKEYFEKIINQIREIV